MFWLCVSLSLVVIAAFIVFYNKIFAVTFDESFAQAVGTHAGAYNLVIAIIIAVIIVSIVFFKTSFGWKMRLVGSNPNFSRAVGFSTLGISFAS